MWLPKWQLPSGCCCTEVLGSALACGSGEEESFRPWGRIWLPSHHQGKMLLGHTRRTLTVFSMCCVLCTHCYVHNALLRGWLSMWLIIQCRVCSLLKLKHSFIFSHLFAHIQNFLVLTSTIALKLKMWWVSFRESSDSGRQCHRYHVSLPLPLVQF